jgi:chromosomal replication initiation ATPase DnaA
VTTAWDRILDQIRPSIPEEDFRRWFGATAYASDSGDQITVWVLTEPIRRHLTLHYAEILRKALVAIDRRHAHVRFVVSGSDEDSDDET